MKLLNSHTINRLQLQQPKPGRYVTLGVLLCLAAWPATARGARSVTLAWDANTEPDVAGYKLHFGTESRNYVQHVDVGDQTRYTVTGLLEDQSYFFAVTAYDSAGFESGFSAELVLDATPPTIPGGFAGIALDSGQIHLKWTPAEDSETGISHYSILRDGVQIATTGETSYTDGGLPSGKRFEYRIRAINGFGLGSLRRRTIWVSTHEPDPSPPTPPPDLAANALSGTEIQLHWLPSTDPESGVSHYAVYRGNQQIGQTRGTSFRDTKVSVRRGYSYSVSAVNGEGLESARTSLVSVAAFDTNDLTAFWAFNEAEGMTARDGSGNGHTARVNGARWVTGQIHSGISFDGADDFIGIGNLDIAGGEGLTIAFWFRADDFEVREARFISKATGESAEDHYWMVSTHNGTALRFRLKAGGTTSELITEEGMVQPEVWHHVAATHDGAAMRIILDGIEVAELGKSGPPDPAPGVAAAIGNQPPGAGSAAFDGTIDEMRLYNRALSDEEISELGTLPSPPVANNDSLPRTVEPIIKMEAAKLLENDYDVDGGALSLAGVDSPSLNGATVKLSGAWVIYSAPPGFTGPDRFTYHVADDTGLSALGVVNVGTGEAGTENRISTVNLTESGTLRLQGVGIPGQSYDIQATESLSEPRWETLGTLTASSSGSYEYEDANALNFEARYYRVIEP